MTRVLGLSLASVALLALIGSGLPGPIGAAAVSVEEKTAREPFTHKTHVSDAWFRLGEEKARDCRGCHLYPSKSNPGAPSRDPDQACELCHYPFKNTGKASIQLDVQKGGFQAEREARSREGVALYPLFKHEDHLISGVTCRMCHAPGPEIAAGAKLQDMFVPSGIGFCVECHDPAFKAAPDLVAGQKLAAKPEAQTRFQEGINRSPRLLHAGEAAVFRHDQHLKAEEMAEGRRCGECHTAMQTAEAAIGEALFRAVDCAKCHVQDASRRVVEFGSLPPIEEKGRTMGTFFHSDHLGESARKKSPSIGGKDCLACHESGTLPDRGVASFPLKAGFERFESCAECHKKEGVLGQKSKAAWNDIPDHGDFGDEAGDKNRCVDCHVEGPLGKLATMRPRRDVERQRPGAFAITVQVHPHITGKAEEKTGDCAACHLAEIKEVPSRIVSAPFNHASHLPRDPARAGFDSCLECHEIAAKEQGGMVEKKDGLGRLVTYKPESCVRCHRGVEKITEKAPHRSEPAPRSPVFDHSDHVKPAGPADVVPNCGACHEPRFAKEKPAAETRDFAYAPKVWDAKDGAEDCRKCHDHGANARRTGGGPGHEQVTREYVSACADCHEAKPTRQGVPDDRAPHVVTRPLVRSMQGNQFHPLPSGAGGQPCAECHKTAEAVKKRDYDDIVPSERQYAHQDFHNSHADGIGGNGGSDCWTCHWGDPIRISAGATPKPYATARKDDGENLTGFPGLKR